MEWTTITVIISLVGLGAAVIKPIVSLTQSITKLTVVVERLEREYHKKRIYLSVVEANRPAAALYESFGFRFTGERDTHGERVMCLRTR